MSAITRTDTADDGDAPDAQRIDSDELQRRLDIAESELAELRAAVLAQRAELRELTSEIPAVMSRSVLMRSMMRDVRHHPDPRGVLRRAVRKARRILRSSASNALRRGSS